MKYISIGLRAFLTIVFVAAGGAKFIGAEMMVATYDTIGLGQWFRYLTGVVEIIGVVLLWIPNRQVAGAALLGATMAGAILTHWLILGPSAVPAVIFGLISAAVLYIHRDQDPGLPWSLWSSSTQSRKRTTMKMLHIALLGSIVFPMTATAWNTGKELSEANFATIDTNENGLLDFGEISEMAESIAFSADSDEDQTISLDEFLAWDFGYAYLADQEGQSDRYTSVKRVMFAVRDLNGDKRIDARELRLSTRWSFERADFDGNAVLSEPEFLNGWTPIVMLKAGRAN